MNIINTIIQKLEYDYFNNMEVKNLYYLSYYCYINGDYYKSYLYSNKVNSKYVSIIYNILSLVRLGYENIACEKFINNLNNVKNLYSEINYLGLDCDTVKKHILQAFIIFKNDNLAKQIQNPLTNEEKIYYFLYNEKNSFKLLNIIVNYEDEYIKNIVLNNMKQLLNRNLLNNIYDTNNLEKLNIKSEQCYDKFYSFNYKDDNVEIISYRLKNNMSSMHILKCKNVCIIIDCGAYIDDCGDKIEINVEKFLKESHIHKSSIKAVFITHGHLDHYGSLNKLKEYEIFMTKETYELINFQNNKSINLDELDITFIKFNETYKICDFNVNPIPNGHILGSSAYLVYIENINKRILFTGDFCLNNQNIIKGMNIENCKNIDYLVTETTYGSKKYSFTYEDRLKLLTELINVSLLSYTPVFIPAFAIGRTQEIVYFLAQNFRDKKILIDGASIEATKIYNKYYKILYDFNNIEFGANDLDELDKFNLFDIIICSSGMLQNGTKSKMYLDIIKNNNKPYTIIKSGFIHSKTQIFEELNFFDGISFNFFDIGISSHATYNQLLYLINLLNPKKIIMVHGEGIKI